MQHGAALDRESGQPALKEAVVSSNLDGLDARLRILCGYARKLTLEPWAMTRADVDVLRAAGLSDRDVVDANQVVSYFNYVNRIADGLGVRVQNAGASGISRR